MPCPPPQKNRKRRNRKKKNKKKRAQEKRAQDKEAGEEKEKEKEQEVEIEYVTEEPDIYDPNFIFFKRIFESFKVRLRAVCVFVYSRVRARSLVLECSVVSWVRWRLCGPQLTDDVKKEKEKEPEKAEKQEATAVKKKGFEEEKKDSDDSDEVGDRRRRKKIFDLNF